MERDFDKKPYTTDEQRVASFFYERGVGGGDDPIGALMIGYSYAVGELNRLRAANADPGQPVTNGNCAPSQGE